jgi:hypothetical protein
VVRKEGISDRRFQIKVLEQNCSIIASNSRLIRAEGNLKRWMGVTVDEPTEGEFSTYMAITSLRLNGLQLIII